jgi:predicted lipoprotein with Yx(FWY)xxD motif
MASISGLYKKRIKMNTIQKFSIALLASISLAACVPLSNNQSIVKSNNGILVSTSNMTLYTFDGDQAGSGKSSCNGDCANNWPPLLVDVNATSYGDYSIITRDDGKKQFAVKGKPLYFFIMDKSPDDRKGDPSPNGMWHVVRM